MNILFVHQNYPGQWREFMPALAASARHRIVFLTQRSGLKAPSDHVIARYRPDGEVSGDSYLLSRFYEGNCRNGLGAARAATRLKARGFTPDLIVGHVGWGEMLYLKDVWPDAKMVGYFEYYFIPEGGCVGYDPEFPERSNINVLLHARNAMNYMTMVRCDGALTATPWQRQTFPAMLADRIEVLHEGVRTDALTPEHSAPLSVDIAGRSFNRDDEIVTYVARNLEPIRGFHTMMRALPMLQQRRPNAQVVIIGGDEVSYGAALPDGSSYRARLQGELGDKVDWSRVHFAGRVAYPTLIDLLRLARVHVYLTVPFVVSWSMLEAMALEKVVIASDVAPVRGFIEHQRTGLLTDFFAPDALAEQIAAVCADPAAYAPLGVAAREHVRAHYDAMEVCFPKFCAYLEKVAGVPAGQIAGKAAVLTRAAARGKAAARVDTRDQALSRAS
ncbi:MAG: glycosyltransferase [Pseudomonadota bacterium]